MSFWIFGRRHQGRRWLYSVEIVWYLLLPLLVMLAAMALVALRAWLHG